MLQAPTVRATRVHHRRGDVLTVTCPWCSNTHTHGAVGPNPGDGDGHRVADCPDSSGAKPNPGYVLREQAPNEPAEPHQNLSRTGHPPTDCPQPVRKIRTEPA